VVESFSWRGTAPLRTAKRELHRARRIARRARRGRLPRTAASNVDEPAIPRSATTSQLALAELRHRPLISILTPVYDVDPQWLNRAVESVRRQSYPEWELCLADDGSTDTATLACLERLENVPGIELVRSESNGGIAAATNRALAQATGEFVAFLDNDDELHPDALLDCVRVLNERPGTDVVYTDEDKIDRRDRHSGAFHKPDWSPELLRGVMYVGHLLFVRRSLVEEAGGLDSRYDGVQDFELMLRVSERTDRIEHVPRVLYHWRKLAGSIARSLEAKPAISELQAAAVNAHLKRRAIPAVARPNPEHPHRTVVEPAARPTWPRVTVIVPTKDAPEHLAPCLDSIFERSTYPTFDVILVDNGTTDEDALRLFERHPVRVLPFDGRFNFSRVNNLAAEYANGDYVLFLNNDTRVETAVWLEELVSLAERDGVGAVGPLLLYANGTVQHAGVVLGIRGTADHIMRGFPRDVDGYAGSLACTREVSAVTGACLLVERRLFVELGGFDEHFATHYQDVDLCLRLRERGLRNLYTPRAVLFHHESTSRGDYYDHLDRALLLDRWGETIAQGDPYYSPLLSLAGADYRPRTA
jgi:GT2 family glycosyltransferase